MPTNHAPTWYALHVLISNHSQMEQLIPQVPALAGLGLNTLIVEVDYFYAYRSHPELQEENASDREQVKRLVSACRAQGIRLIPQFQCLGHQSWAEQTYALLSVHPEFDETPGQYPRNEGIYCRSWCPRHPGVNPILFDLFDELLADFEADALHVGMDEVFLIGSEFCPRCQGAHPGDLYAQAVNAYHAHLSPRGVEMLMWGDRLLDDRTMGYGLWEASQNGTHTAIAQIPRDIIICDWHYELRTSYPSIPFLLDQGFRVLPGGWRELPAIEALIDDAQCHASDCMLGYLATTWNGVQTAALSAWPPIVMGMKRLESWKPNS